MHLEIIRAQEDSNTNAKVQVQEGMSGSDLAPFIGAVLRDTTIDEMKNEIDELRSTLTEYVDERLLVQITGKNGTPVHYETSFKNAEPTHNDDEIG